jgi:hypothetical protein
MARTSGPLGCSTLLNHETSHQAQLRARIHPNSTFSFHCKVCSPENRNAVQSFPAKRGQATRKGTQSLETSARRESLAQNCSTEKFFLLCSGGLEPAFRVLFSAIFHGVSLGKFHQGRKRRILVEGKLLQSVAHLRTFFPRVLIIRYPFPARQKMISRRRPSNRSSWLVFCC